MGNSFDIAKTKLVANMNNAYATVIATCGEFKLPGIDADANASHGCWALTVAATSFANTLMTCGKGITDNPLTLSAYVDFSEAHRAELILLELLSSKDQGVIPNNYTKKISGSLSSYYKCLDVQTLSSLKDDRTDIPIGISLEIASEVAATLVRLNKLLTIILKSTKRK